jgi:undecaprenyl-phosphate 4-deoxy-4-formamido-L-arabinose transferase
VNKLVSRLAGSNINDLGSGMKAYRREIVERMCLSTHHSRYIPAETAWLGVRVGEVKVGHRERAAGESKYGLGKLLRVNFDMIASISTAPVQIIGVVGLFFSLVGFAMALRLTYVRLFVGNLNELQMVAAIMFLIAGVQMVCTSILCEYISRIYIEVQNRPYYIVGEILE